MEASNDMAWPAQLVSSPAGRFKGQGFKRAIGTPSPAHKMRTRPTLPPLTHHRSFSLLLQIAAFHR